MAQRKNRPISRIWVSSLTSEQRLDIKEKTQWWDNLFPYERIEPINRAIQKNLESEEKSELWKKIVAKIGDKISVLKMNMGNRLASPYNLLELEKLKAEMQQRWKLYIYPIYPISYLIDSSYIELYERELNIDIYNNNLLEKLTNTKKLLYSHKYQDELIDPQVIERITSKNTSNLLKDMYKKYWKNLPKSP